MDKRKSIHFWTSRQLWREFKQMFPYRGEPSAFFNRCMEAAVKARRRRLSEEAVQEAAQKAKEIS